MFWVENCWCTWQIHLKADGDPDGELCEDLPVGVAQRAEDGADQLDLNRHGLAWLAQLGNLLVQSEGADDVSERGPKARHNVLRKRIGRQVARFELGKQLGKPSVVFGV